MSYINQFKNFIKDQQPKKSIFRIIFEMLIWTIAYKELPFFYMQKMLYRVENKNYRDYLSAKEYAALLKSRILHNPAIAVLYRNKILFDRILTDAGISTPVLYAYKIGNYIYLKRSDEKLFFDGIDSLKNILKKILSFNLDIFIKPVDTQGGADCYVLTNVNIDLIAQNLISLNVVLFQEKLQQHEAINRIYPHSINTLRIDTYIDDYGGVVFLNALMRFGANNSVVDNPGVSRGFFVQVNINTGEIEEKGIQFLKTGGDILYEHPDTKEVFGHIFIPNFIEAKELISKALRVLPERLVGWDIAIISSGPVIIEGNDNPYLGMSDMACGGYKKNPKMKEILTKIK